MQEVLEIQSELREVHQDIAEVSRNLHAVGLGVPSDQLREASLKLNLTIARLEQYCNDRLNQDLRDARELTGSILGAVLGGAIQTPPKEEDLMDITAGDMYFLLAHSITREEAQKKLAEYGCRVNGVETNDPNYVIGNFVLTDFKVGKRQYIREE